MAATLSELKQPGSMPGLPSQQTLYAATLAPGAMPEPVPSSMTLPSMVTAVP